MKFTKEVNNVKFVFTKDEIGYQEVLDDFRNTSYIFILTFNISENNDMLINQLKQVSDETTVEIFTNIPQRYEHYFSDRAREQARKKIKVYLEHLDPEKYQSIVNTHYCFDNHSKIIMTNNVVYVGSANFSDESKNNFESGFIVYDKEFIAFIKNNIIPYLKNNSEPYYSNIPTRFKIMLRLIYLKLVNAKERIHMSTHAIADHAGNYYEYYDVHNNSLSLLTIEYLDSVLKELEDLLPIILQDLDSEGLLTDEIEKYIGNINISNIRELYSEDTKIFELARFDEEDYAIEYLQEHAIEAYDEYLDSFQETAAQEAAEQKTLLAYNAEQEINNLLKVLSALETDIEKIINLLPSSERNPNIDNTR